MICIYPADCTDFSSNGLGALAPQSAEVSETLNGSYELTLVHPQDDAGKWRRLAEGRIIRVPVPAAMTPILTMETSASPAREVWRISTRRDPLRLRSGTGTNYTILTKDFLHGHAFERSLIGAVLKSRREADIPRNDTGNILDCREAWQSRLH